MASLGEKTIRNSVYGFLSYAAPIVFSIILTPVIIGKLGVEKYGLFVLGNTITGFMSLLKFGMGYGVAKAVSEYFGHRRPEGVGEVIASTASVLFGVGLLGFGVAAAVGVWGMDFLKIPPADQPQARMMFVIAGLAFVLASVESAFTNVLAGAQRLDIYAKIYLGGTTFMNAAMLILAMRGYGVAALVAAQLAANFLTLTGYYLASRSLLAPIPIRPGFYRRHFVPILKFNLYAYFHEAASALLFQLDKVIISVFSGPAAVSFYNIAGTISQKIQGVSGSLTSIFFPISSALTAAGQHQDLRGVYRRAMRIIIMLAGGMALTVAVFGEQILRYWLGPEFAEKSLAALYVLAATYFLLAIFVTISHFLIGLGGVKRLAGYTALFLVLNISFLLILLPRHGIAGAAWAYFLSLLPLPRFIYEVERSFLGLAETTRFYGTAAAKLAAAGSIYCLLAGFGLRPLVFNLWSVIVAGGASFLAYLGIYKAMGFFDPGDWNIMRRTAKRVFSRNPAAAERE